MRLLKNAQRAGETACPTKVAQAVSPVHPSTTSEYSRGAKNLKLCNTKALVAGLCIIAQCAAQEVAIAPVNPSVPSIVRSYVGPIAPPTRLTNSARLHQLIRAGKLYLTVQDAIALVIENNLGLEVNRYGPLVQQWQVYRQEGGGALRGVTNGNSLSGSVASGQGVSGSMQSTGIGVSGGGNNGTGGGNATVQQIGPVAPNFDPFLQSTAVFSHITAPQANAFAAQTSALVEITHAYQTRYQQGLASGGFVYVQQNENYLKENAPDLINPSVYPRIQILLQHSLLQGFGTGLNTRFIRIAKKNVLAGDETFRSQLLDLVANTVNLYYDLVSDNDQLKSRQNAVQIAQKFYEDTKTQIDLGTLAKVELPRSESELASRKQDLLIAEQTLRQREVALKDALTRVPDPELEEAQIVPLDRIEVPANDDLPTLRQLVAVAMAKRPDVAAAKYRDQASEINALGTANGILPIAVGQVYAYDVGSAGTPAPGAHVNPQNIGGLGKAFGQVFKRDYPTERAVSFFQGTIHNRQAQADYGIDQLQLKQGDLTTARTNNQIVVDISNAMVALRQARSRYNQAINTRQLQDQLLQAEQNRFSFGTSTISNLIIAQRALVTAQTSEIGALTAYAHARVSLDQTLGQTLEVNHVSVDEGLKGRIQRESKVPETAPAGTH